jgi:hypothetical protein
LTMCLVDEHCVGNNKHQPKQSACFQVYDHTCISVDLTRHGQFDYGDIKNYLI